MYIFNGEAWNIEFVRKLTCYKEAKQRTHVCMLIRCLGRTGTCFSSVLFLLLFFFSSLLPLGSPSLSLYLCLHLFSSLSPSLYTQTELMTQIASPTKNWHAPPPTESRKSNQSVNPIITMAHKPTNWAASPMLLFQHQCIHHKRVSETF